MASKSAAAKALVGRTESGPQSLPPAKASSGGAKVTIACKIAVPWFDLELCQEVEKSENTQTGPRTIKEWNRTGKFVRVRGTAYPTGQAPDGFPDRPQMVAGAALTSGVDKDFWDEWSKQHAKSPYVLNGMIFAHETRDAAAGEAKERKDERSGLEPVERTKKEITDKRVVRPTVDQVAALAPGERT